MGVKCELIPLPPDRVADAIHAICLTELAGQIRYRRVKDREVALLCQRLDRDACPGVVFLDHRQTGGGEGRDSRRVVEVVPVGTADIAAVVAGETVEPAGIVLAELGDPAILVDVGVEVKVTRRETACPLDPGLPLAVGEVAVEVEMDAFRAEFGDRLRVQPDRSAGDNGVNLAIAGRDPL
jgi:hypothetical protein